VVSKEDVKQFCLAAFIERKALAYALIDTTAAVEQLDTFLMYLMAPTVDLFTFIVLLGLDSGDYWAVFPSALLGLSFVFAPSIQRAMDCIQLVFVRAPYEGGDVVLISSMPGVLLRVVQVHLLHTTFQQELGGARVIKDNSSLVLENIQNVSQGEGVWKQINFIVDMTFSHEDTAVLNEKLAEYVAANSDDVTEISLLIKSPPADSDHNKLKLVLNLWVGLTHPGADLGRTTSAMSRLTAFTAACLVEDIGVWYSHFEGAMMAHSLSAERGSKKEVTLYRAFDAGFKPNSEEITLPKEKTL